MTLVPVPRWIKDAIGWALSPLLLPLFALAWFFNWWDRATGPAPRDGWQRWFAWTPTQLGRWKGSVVWLEPVERSRWGDGYLFRRPGDTSILSSWEMPDE